MDIEPATVTQVRQGQDGRMVAIDDDVASVAADLQRINKNLRVRWAEQGEYFVVYERVLESSGESTDKLVLTARTLDKRIVHRVERIAHESYDYAGELDAKDKAAEQAKVKELSETLGPAHERLAHAIRKDLGSTSRIIVPRDLK